VLGTITSGAGHTPRCPPGAQRSEAHGACPASDDPSQSGCTNYYIYGADHQPLEQINTITGTVTWLHHDQIGSTRLLTDNTGATVGTNTYDPYGTGTSTTGTVTTPLGYTGQYTDTETGLVYLRARYYDPGTAQFLTVDPALAITGQSYAYISNNPLNGTDQTGLWFGIDDLVASGVGALVGGGTSIVEQGLSGDGINWSKVGISAASGAAGGEASLYCGPFCGGAIAAGLNEAGTEYYDKGSVDPSHVALSSASGGITGLFANSLISDFGGGHFADGLGDPGFGPQVGSGGAWGIGGDYVSNFLWGSTSTRDNSSKSSSSGPQTTRKGCR
jgi:RHS repeat-associated protein